ncbi:MAG: hypothetical protein LBI01_01735 [Elusimicrobium sp.]|jgi:hypothetical protein|nr:hypothetical protein [Elusimicrobium sp.]
MDTEILEQLKNITKQLEKITKLMEDANAASARKESFAPRKFFDKKPFGDKKDFGKKDFRPRTPRFDNNGKPRFIADGRGYDSRRKRF